MLTHRATYHPLFWTGEEGGRKEGSARAMLLNSGLSLAKA